MGEKKPIASQRYRNNRDGFKFISLKVPHTAQKSSLFNLRSLSLFVHLIFNTQIAKCDSLKTIFLMFNVGVVVHFRQCTL